MKLATLCYLQRDGKTLMIHRIKKKDDIHRDKWNGLGGKLQPGESPEECVIREVKEETNMDLSPEFLCYVDEIFPEKNIHNVALMFYGKATNEPKADAVEVSDIKWFSINKALKLNLAFTHNEVIRRFALRKK